MLIISCGFRNAAAMLNMQIIISILNSQFILGSFLYKRWLLIEMEIISKFCVRPIKFQNQSLNIIFNRINKIFKLSYILLKYKEIVNYNVGVEKMCRTIIYCSIKSSLSHYGLV